MTTLLIAFIAGLAAGFLDVLASEVQAPLLLLMLSAFAVALLTRARAWRIALAVAAGLPLAHLIAYAVRGGDPPSWGMVIAFVPVFAAALGGKGVSALLTSTSSTLEHDQQSPPGERLVSHRGMPIAHLLGIALAGCSLVGAVPVYATSVARGQPIAWWVTTWWQIATFLGWAVGAPFVLRLWNALRSAESDGIRASELSTHAAVVAGIGIAHAAALPLLTRALFVPLGASGVAGAVPWALAAYLPLDALAYVLVIGLGHASSADRIARAAQAREVAIRGELATARLASLRAQLRPHFLFNALNAATVLIRRGDAKSGERVLAGLSELLRYVLRGAEDEPSSEAPGSELVRLDEEIAFAEAYLAIESERFPDRLRARVDVTAETRIARVPHLLLQPLVENAVKHGIADRRGIGNVVIRAWRTDSSLHVSVEDDGPGIGNEIASSGGIGLANTRARLASLYGASASLTLERGAQGGTVAHVVLPWTP